MFCPVPEQIDEGLAGKQRQFEGWIHNLNKELNHYKAVNVELSSKLKEFCGSAIQQKEHVKGEGSSNNNNDQSYRGQLTAGALTSVVVFQLVALIINWQASTQWTK